jgi:predicted Zn-dependent protease
MVLTDDPLVDASLDEAARAFARQAPALDFWSLRLVDEWEEALSVRQGVLLPVQSRRARGALVSVSQGGGQGYAATSDLSHHGLLAALGQALGWAQATVGLGLVPPEMLPRPDHRGRYETPVERPWVALELAEKIAWLTEIGRTLKVHERIVDWEASLGYRRSDVLLVASSGAWIEQRFHDLTPGLRVVANRGSRTQQRSGGGALSGRRGGLEQLASLGFADEAPLLAEQALQLLDAPECPEGRRDLILLPRQMALQIHESIGHPLELDRILGDERNYAGTSFVTPEMFGRFRYGSELLNVTFDPGRAGELAGYAFDDEGTPAERVYLIRGGILERPLGGAASQARSGLPGTANARASDWFRPPIDRMANLNLEPGTSSLEGLIAAVERGLLVDANRSWSIDDSRNKFQFGCEIGWLIEDGSLGQPVRNPNYRGVSEHFWRSLAGVGDESTCRVEGVVSCGKGEPNQMIRVGHAAPACLFRGVDLFGGEG